MYVSCACTITESNVDVYSCADKCIWVKMYLLTISAGYCNSLLVVPSAKDNYHGVTIDTW